MKFCHEILFSFKTIPSYETRLLDMGLIQLCDGSLLFIIIHRMGLTEQDGICNYQVTHETDSRKVELHGIYYSWEEIDGM